MILPLALVQFALSFALSAGDASRVLTARNMGLAQLEEGRNKEARATFAKLATLVTDDPLPLANGGIAALRDGDIAGAQALVEKAIALSGKRADLLALRAAVAEARNQAEEMRAALLAAAAADPRALETRWRMVKSVDNDPAAPPALKETRRRMLSEIVAASPASLPARLRLLVLDLEAGSGDASNAGLAELEKLLEGSDGKTLQYLGECSALRAKGDLKGASLKARILENLQRVTPRYLQSLAELFTPVQGLPVETFAPRLETSLRARAGSPIPVVLRASAAPAEDPSVTLRRVDLANTGKAEVYAPAAPHAAAAFLDFDLDGDLDVYLHGASAAPDKLLRNNLDGTWADVTTATGESKVSSRRAIACDLDRDGDIDLLTVSPKGALVLRDNLRQGRFRSVPLGVDGVSDVAAEDVDGDGLLDVAAGTSAGAVLLLGQDGAPPRRAGADAGLPAGDVRALALADLDNDGFADLVASGPSGLAAVRNTGGRFQAWNAIAPGEKPVDRILAVDADRDGDLDLVLARTGQASLLTNEGGNANGWLTVVLEGLPKGSGKVNRAGVGSLVEVKAGDLSVARWAGLLPVHIGLGARGRADVVRCTFTNGVPQNVLDARAKTVVKEIQKLKGSCPFVYARNGETGAWSFVSDALGRAPIGLLFDGVHLAEPDPREWLFVDGDALRPGEDGRLEIDYTEELWEAAFLDEATLVAVDHPIGTAVVPNERTVPGKLEKRLFIVCDARPPRAATSDAYGTPRDVLDLVRHADGLHVDPGPETAYQGLRDEHTLVLDLGDLPRAPLADARVMLYLRGWIFYTDTSINVSVSQRKDLRPLPPVLEVPDGNGGWRVAMRDFGFPAGKTKTMPVDLTGLVDPRDPRVRIRTSLAVFWDEIAVTVGDGPVPVVSTPMAPERAVLSERGFSRRVREVPDGPEVFVHDDVTKGPLWEDPPGFVTRLGDVTELLTKTDDRWVAFKGGDAIRIAYDARVLPPLAPGWRRDYILVSDGWDKDFDRNTVTGETIGPYPFHAMSAYPYPDNEAHPDPDFLREWMTRPSGPAAFREAMRPRR